MENVSTTTVSNDVETLQKAFNWIKYSCFGGIACLVCFMIIPIIPILQYLGFKTLTQHNFKSISTFARLMLLRLCIAILTTVLLVITFILVFSLPSYETYAQVLFAIFGILAFIVSIFGAYLECMAYSALLQNPQINNEYKELINACHMMTFFFSLPPLSVLRACGFLGPLYFIYYRQYDALFSNLEKITVDTETTSSFDWKEHIKHPSRIEKGYLISIVTLIILLALTTPIFLLL